MDRIREAYGQKRIVFLRRPRRLATWGLAPFAGGLRLRYPPQKFLVILEIDIDGYLCLCRVHGP